MAHPTLLASRSNQGHQEQNQLVAAIEQDRGLQADSCPSIQSPIRSEISQQTSDALVRVLAKSPADRFLSYDEFGMTLEAARSQWLIQRYSQAAQTKATKSKTSWWRR